MKKAFLSLLLVAAVCINAEAGAQSPAVHHVAKGARPCMMVDSKGHLHCAFEAFENPNQMPDIFYTKSVDLGASWSNPKAITKTPGLSLHPAIAVEKSGAIDIVWSDPSSDPDSPDIYFSRSNDDGDIWTKPLDISSTPGVSLDAAIAIGNNDSIHVVWTDTTISDKNRDIFYSCSLDGGLKWSAPIDISNTQGTSLNASIAAAPDGRLHVAWADTASGDIHQDIFYTQHKGESWTAVTDLSKTKGISEHPSILCTNTAISLTWADNSTKAQAADIWLATGDATGKLGKILNVSNTPGVSTEPKTAMSGYNFAVVWCDTTAGSKMPNVYAAASRDKAVRFSSCINISHTREVSKHPSVTISGDKMFVAWEESNAKNAERVIKVTSVDLKVMAPRAIQRRSHSLSR